VALPAAFGIKFFDLVVSALLLPLGGVAHRHQAGPAGRPRPPRHIPSPVLIGLAAAGLDFTTKETTGRSSQVHWPFRAHLAWPPAGWWPASSWPLSPQKKSGGYATPWPNVAAARRRSAGRGLRQLPAARAAASMRSRCGITTYFGSFGSAGRYPT